MRKLLRPLRKLVDWALWYFADTDEPLPPIPGCRCGECTDFYFVCTGCREKSEFIVVAPCCTQQINGRYYCLDCAKESLMKRQTLEELFNRKR
jgi:hypothetical protein